MDFLFHKVSEKEKEQIKKQAKEIIDSFSRKLSSVRNLEEPIIERKEFERDEKDEKCDNDFRKIMFENAQHKKLGFIIAEKRKWN